MEQMFVGFLILLAFYIFDRNTVRVEWTSLGGFLAFMSLVTFIRLGMYDLAMAYDPNAIPQMHAELLSMPKILFAMVWWEDAFYVLPIFLAYKYLPRNVAHAIALFSSVHFGLGHAYQGLGGILITSLYPYFISYRYGIKYGFGTVMVGHIMYDFITYFTVIVAPMLL